MLEPTARPRLEADALPPGCVSGESLSIEVEVPAASAGVLVLPGSAEEIPVGPGRHSFTTTFRAVADDPERPFFGWRRPEPVLETEGAS